MFLVLMLKIKTFHSSCKYGYYIELTVFIHTDVGEFKILKRNLPRGLQNIKMQQKAKQVILIF